MEVERLCFEKVNIRNIKGRVRMDFIWEKKQWVVNGEMVDVS